MTPPRDTEPRQCRRWDDKSQTWGWKHRYGTRAGAMAAGPGQDVYLCDECRFWHRASRLPPPRTLTLTFHFPWRLPKIRRHR